MAQPLAHILVADDQADVLEALRLLLKSEGFKMEAVTSPAKALAALEQRDFDVVLMDLNYARDTTSGQEGLDLLPKIQALDGSLPVVVMTAWANIELAVEAMRRGARDFIQKPWDNTRLLSIIRNQVELANAHAGDRSRESVPRGVRGIGDYETGHEQVEGQMPGNEQCENENAGTGHESIVTAQGGLRQGAWRSGGANGPGKSVAKRLKYAVSVKLTV